MINFYYFNHDLQKKLFILRTDIKTEKRVKAIKPFFDNHSNILEWSIDIEDIDNVLKIEAIGNLNESDVIHQIKAQGFYCDALPD